MGIGFSLNSNRVWFGSCCLKLLGFWVLIQFGCLTLMGPIRGFRKRKKTEKKPEENASGSGSSEKEGPVDWWDEFFKRINGIFFLCYFWLLYYICSLLVFIFCCYIMMLLLNSHILFGFVGSFLYWLSSGGLVKLISVQMN